MTKIDRFWLCAVLFFTFTISNFNHCLTTQCNGNDTQLIVVYVNAENYDARPGSTHCRLIGRQRAKQTYITYAHGKAHAMHSQVRVY